VGCSGASGTKLLHTVARRCIVLYRNIDFKKKLSPLTATGPTFQLSELD
jgi:hypothetical protein